jgi:trehalose 6-phosphate phosphatase
MSSVDTVVSRIWQVLQVKPAALITDVDGTISRIAPTPEEAFVGEPARSALRAILPHLALTAVITGRPTAVAEAMVAVEGLTYVGSYALEGAAAATIDPEALRGARDEVSALLAPLPGVRLEEKEVSFALHYRECEDRRAARRQLLSIAAPIAGRAGAKIVEGKQVLEVVPAALPDKGTAVRHLLAQHKIEGVVYFGDDIGDVAAFRELRTLRETFGLQSLVVAIIDAETDESVLENADLTLNGVDEMEDVLTALAAMLDGGEAPWSGE